MLMISSGRHHTTATVACQADTQLWYPEFDPRNSCTQQPAYNQRLNYRPSPHPPAMCKPKQLRDPLYSLQHHTSTLLKCILHWTLHIELIWGHLELQEITRIAPVMSSQRDNSAIVNGFDEIFWADSSWDEQDLSKNKFLELSVIAHFLSYFTRFHGRNLVSMQEIASWITGSVLYQCSLSNVKIIHFVTQIFNFLAMQITEVTQAYKQQCNNI